MFYALLYSACFVGGFLLGRLHSLRLSWRMWHELEEHEREMLRLEASQAAALEEQILKERQERQWPERSSGGPL